MTLFELREKLQHLESQRINLDNEILKTKRELEKLSPFSKEQKIELFKSLFIGRYDVFAKYWISSDGLKKVILQQLTLLKEMIIFQFQIRLSSNILKEKSDLVLML